MAQQLAEAGVDLVLAGHRHRLDPAFGHTIDAAGPEQWPLPAGLAQMVAISPTIPTDVPAARKDPEGSPRSGLCVYRLMVASGALSLHRVIHSTEPGTGDKPILEGATITGLSVRRTTMTGPAR